MGKTSALALIRKHIDIKAITDNISFMDEAVAEAAREQPELYLKASIYRVQKMRKKQAREARLKLHKAELARRVRITLLEEGQGRVTDKQIEERVSRNSNIQELERRLRGAEQEEELAKGLLQTLQMRRDALKISAELIGAEVYVSRKLEGGNTS